MTFNDSNKQLHRQFTTVSPGSITVNNNNGNYTFNGSTIAGTGALTKSGTSALTINTSNSYSGGTTLNAGSLNLGNPSAGHRHADDQRRYDRQHDRQWDDIE